MEKQYNASAKYISPHHAWPHTQKCTIYTFNAVVTSHTLFGYPGNGHLSKNFLLYKTISVISVFHNFT